MEIKINKEIRDYTESFFFGLSMRQSFFSAVACVLSVGCYYGLRPVLGVELTSWLCVLAVLPCAVLGFVTYNGMTAEQLLWAWFRSEVVMPKRLTFRDENIYRKVLEKREERTGSNGTGKR